MNFSFGLKSNSILQDIWQGFRSRPDRTMLSFLAVTIGVSLLTLLLLIVGGLRQKSKNLTRELGINVFAVIGDAGNEPSESFPLTEKHLSVLRANLADCLISGVRRFDLTACGRKLPVLATDSRLLAVRQWNLGEGRFLDPEDLRQAARYCAITSGLSRELNLHPGDVIPLNGIPFRVVGAVNLGGQSLTDSEMLGTLKTGELAVFVPQPTTRGWPEGTRAAGTAGMNAIFVRVSSAGDMPRVIHLVDRLLSSPDMQVAGLRLIGPETLLEGLRRLEVTVTTSLGSITLSSLLLAGLTLLVLSLANVRERVTEIGLRRALGATPGDVASLFLLETCLLTGLAAILADANTHLVVLFLRPKLPVPVQTNLGTFVIPPVLAVCLAVLSALGPARAASRISPAEALRTE